MGTEGANEAVLLWGSWGQNEEAGASRTRNNLRMGLGRGQNKERSGRSDESEESEESEERS